MCISYLFLFLEIDKDRESGKRQKLIESKCDIRNENRRIDIRLIGTGDNERNWETQER